MNEYINSIDYRIMKLEELLYDTTDEQERESIQNEIDELIKLKIRTKLDD